MKNQLHDLLHLKVVGRESVQPTPDILDALVKDYPLQASIADLVDNSLDAGASRVLIRFLRQRGRVVGLCVADNGRGITSKDADRALQFGGKRDYGKTDLGMFGVGLKTASLSHANTLIVVSRSANDIAIGRQWTMTGIKHNNWALDRLDRKSVEWLLERKWGKIGAIKTGTIVQWNDVRDFMRLKDGFDEYLADACRRIQNHLGLKLHRFLEKRKVSIELDSQDLDTMDVGLSTSVDSMNPFPEAGAEAVRGFPKTFRAQFPGAPKAVSMLAHIWPKKSTAIGYKLGGGKVAEHQGFYFYRHGRLITEGGWCGVKGTNEPHLSLARVEIDIPDELGDYLKIQSTKARVDVPDSFAECILNAQAKDGTDFKQFLEAAEATYRTRGKAVLKPMMRPGSGIPADVRTALEKCGAPFSRKEFSISWGNVRGNDFVNVEFEEREIVLNTKYRSIFLRGRRGGSTDIPAVRTLLYFVFERLLSGQKIGPVERRHLEVVSAALNAALRLEMAWAGE